MGNIQTVNHKRKPIFNKQLPFYMIDAAKQKSLHQRLNLSPYNIKSVVKDIPRTDRSYSPQPSRKQKPFQPIREDELTYTRATVTPKVLKKSWINDGQAQTQRKSYAPQNHYQQNKTKCSEIIKKVRNFNDFLNEVKRKMKCEQQQQLANSYLKTSKKSQSKSLQLLLKLQNQKLELEKYKKLVERQLSKQHSIESIAIQSKNEREKVLKISYENQPKRQRIKQKYIEVVQKVQELGTLIDVEDGKSKRVKNINNLMYKLEEMHQQQLKTQAQIVAVIEDDDSD